ncbi:MAG: hypothetical protein CVU05_13980 [Bacteroidetes bacterium HGW-Bacteroidetes-21]|jgi:hypothetical protein|nr:MAG: hypothetical protein CVU05_13980 [Bacteroidetes bacterium HGW-Bacteroidetes-21]
MFPEFWKDKFYTPRFWGGAMKMLFEEAVMKNEKVVDHVIRQAAFDALRHLKGRTTKVSGGELGMKQ